MYLYTGADKVIHFNAAQVLQEIKQILMSKPVPV
jgi:hypothetical protein